MIAVADRVEDEEIAAARSELAGCRSAIEDLDQRIIALLAERVALGQRTAGL